MSIELDKTGIPTTSLDDSENDYSVELSDYFYHKLSNISNSDEFTSDEINNYDLTVDNDEIDISTTSKLIKYLKGFTQKCVKSLKSEHDSFVVDMGDEIDRLEGLINDIETNIGDDILNKTYPVGSVYMTFDSTNPSVSIGGSWIKLQDRFLLGSGIKSVGTTGGEENHVLTESEMPSHTHIQEEHKHGQNDYQGHTMSYQTISNDTDKIDVASNGRKLSSLPSGTNHVVYYSADGSNGAPYLIRRPYTDSQTPTINNAGSGEAHNNMPPYQVVHMWRRVS